MFVVVVVERKAERSTIKMESRLSSYFQKVMHKLISPKLCLNAYNIYSCWSLDC